MADDDDNDPVNHGQLSDTDVRRIATEVVSMLNPTPPDRGLPANGDTDATTRNSNAQNLLGVLPHTVPTLPISGVPNQQGVVLSFPPLTTVDQNVISSPKPAAMLVAEGIPPISSKLVDKIKRREYVDLSDLLTDMQIKTEESIVSTSSGNQVIFVESMESAKKKKRQISDLGTWLQAFSAYAATIISDKDTTSPEATGLMAHMYLITQISQDLKGTRWYRYDKEFRAWAAATQTKVWGTLNVSIYGRCLTGPTMQPDTPAPSKGPSNKLTRPRPRACYKYNYEGSCGRDEVDCYFDHVCCHCGTRDHRAPECAKKARTQKK